MKKYYAVGLTVILLMAVTLTAYGTYLNRSDENQIAKRMAERTIPLQGEKAKVRNLNPVFSLDTINLTAAEMSDAVALINGRLESAFVEKNSSVRRGQVLFDLVNEEIPTKIQQAESDVSAAEARLLQAKNSFARYERLKEKNATSMEKFDEAKMNYEAAKANLQGAIAARNQLLIQDSRQQVISPVDGEILIIYKPVGSYVTAGTPVAPVGNFGKLNFSLPIADDAAKRLTPGEKFELKFTDNALLHKAYDTEYGAGNKGHSQTFSVSVKNILPNLSEPADMRKVIFEIDNTAGVLEQQTYNGVELKRLKAHNALTVPLSAMGDNNKNFVFVVKEDDTLERRAVQTGADDGKFIEILSGLKEGETVITSSTKGLDGGMKVSITLAGDEN